MLPLPSDSQQFEIEAHLRLGQIRVICNALLEGQWLPDPKVYRHIGVLAELAAQFIERAGWPTDWADDERAA